MAIKLGPEIERVKTEVYFRDARGAEWEVVDAVRRSDGSLKAEHASCPNARFRYFVRYEYRGAFGKIAREIRRYRFRRDESRWFQADLWQEQLDAADVRPLSPRG